MKYIDLHLHSHCSDGTMSPAELVREAERKNVTAIAITDHDTVEGVEEALAEGEKRGIEVISGVEISAYLDDLPMHILGYGFHHEDASLKENLKKVQAARHERNLRILEKLYALGLPITEEELSIKSTTGQAGRPHIATLLVDKKIVKSMNEAFAIYLRKDGLAYAGRQELMAADAIDLIRKAGGVAVLAHPLTIDRTMIKLPSVLQALRQIKLAGIEAYYPTHSGSVRKKLVNLGKEYDMIITGGSDFHGSIRSGTKLGGNNKKQRVPYEIFEKLKDKISKSSLQPST